MELNKGFSLEAGKIHGTIFGGPFRKFDPTERRLVGVKMAKEIDHPHDISIPTEDYSVPCPKDLLEGILEAIDSMNDGNDIYVGCMGGIGRTGLFMAVIYRAFAEYNGGNHLPGIQFVRKHYNPHAVETAEQMRYVSLFDVSPIVRHLTTLNSPAVVKVPFLWTDYVKAIWPWAPI